MDIKEHTPEWYLSQIDISGAYDIDRWHPELKPALPQEWFTNFAKLTNFADAFRNCTSLQQIPAFPELTEK